MSKLKTELNIHNNALEHYTEPLLMPTKKLDLQMVCYKINHSFPSIMESLIRQKLYFSKSEIVRMATLDYYIYITAYTMPLIDFPAVPYYLDDEIKPPKNSGVTKLPVKLVQTIDILVQTYGVSRSFFINQAIHHYFETKQALHGQKISSNDKRIKVIAFKLPLYQIVAINSLIQTNWLESISESMRYATIIFIESLLLLKNTTDSLEMFYIENINTFSNYTTNETKSVCTKMPTNLLVIIDTIVKHYSFFENRTLFIRLAVDYFLQSFKDE